MGGTNYNVAIANVTVDHHEKIRDIKIIDKKTGRVND